MGIMILKVSVELWVHHAVDLGTVIPRDVLRPLV